MTMTPTERATDVVARVFKAFMSKFWYPYLTRRLDSQGITFLNFGYEDEPPLAIPLDPADEPNRYSIQLYQQTATQVDVAARQVLEVSCGHGGGASYLTRTLSPAAYTGLDYNPDGVAYCQKTYDLAGLTFVQGDAGNLPFEDESFDVVLNVEASHAYPQLSRFLAEVARVLRPGGHFLYTDFRGRSEFAGWDAALAEMPLRQVSQRVINASVLRSLDRSAEQKLELVSNKLPAIFRPFGRRFAGVPGTGLYNVFKSGDAEYRIYCFVKE